MKTLLAAAVMAMLTGGLAAHASTGPADAVVAGPTLAQIPRFFFADEDVVDSRDAGIGTVLRTQQSPVQKAQV